MSTSENFVAGFDGSSSQYLAVYIDGTALEVVKLSVTRGAVTTVGLLENAPASGEVAEVTFEGIGYGIAADALEPGDELCVTTGGKLTAADTTADAIIGKYMPGTTGGAYPDDAVAGQRVRVFLYPNKTVLVV